jgi:ATP-dependent helicase HepA
VRADQAINRTSSQYAGVLPTDAGIDSDLVGSRAGFDARCDHVGVNNSARKGLVVPFSLGQVVAVRADRSRVGPVVDVLPAIDSVSRYRVFHSPGHMRDYAEDQLVAVEEAQPPAGSYLLRADEFQTALAAVRLAHPISDHVYALRAARIQFIPFQFRPLLRMLRADQPRLLIADEVGVGKTIEAGLILKELSVRQTLDRVLIACPKALTYKWQQEMRRFDEYFEILTAERLRYCLREAHLEGAWPTEYRRSIVHYELLRLDPYLHGADDGRRRRHGLLELDPAPAFDLVIADEAHHLRTPGSNIHEAAEFLSQVSEALLLLSATPVQLGVENLFTLLALLRPDLFTDPQNFERALEPNRYLTRAIRLLRTGETEGEARVVAQQHLEDVARTNWGRTVIAIDPGFEAVRQRLNDPSPLSDRERVEAARTLEELHTLAHIMNRTRRRDIGRFTIREPHTVAVDFTSAQRAAYDRILELRRDQLLEEHDPFVVRLLLDTLQRQAASCLPALLQLLTSEGDDVEFTDDPEAATDEGATPRLRRHPLQGHPELVTLAEAAADDDPKFDQLRRLVLDTVGGTGPGKILVFSFFLHTLGYLAQRLEGCGVRVGLVTGKVDDFERQVQRDRFRLPRSDPEALDVLLSSEVGCEGLDYEFCDRLVNYDIPWNPMRIEQRIGRIDRFGQQADKVLIFNFITPGTVEERVFFRCYERLGIFRETIGEIEAVLGDLTQQLNEIALDHALTPEQTAERTRQLADNALRLRAETETFEASSRELLGWDESLMQDLAEVQDTGHTVAPAQILELVRSLLARADVGGSISGSPSGILQIRCPRTGRGALVAMLEDPPEGADPRLVQKLRHWLDSESASLTATTDQATAVTERQVEFLTASHPLTRLAVREFAPGQGKILSAHLSVNTSALPHGDFIFALELWETIAARPEMRTIAVAVDEATGQATPEVESQLLTLLAEAQAHEPGRPVEAGDTLELDVRAERLRRQALDTAVAANAVIIGRQRSSLDAHHQLRAMRVTERLHDAQEPRIVRMLTAQQRRVDADYRRRLAALDARAEVDIVPQRIAVGRLEITNAQ